MKSTHFTNYLQETTDSIQAREKSVLLGLQNSYRMFEPFVLPNGKFLSVQASVGHYCNPRRTSLNLDVYESMELAVMTNDYSFIRIDSITDDLDLIESFEKYYEGTVYGCVPVDLIQVLFVLLVSNNAPKWID